MKIEAYKLSPGDAVRRSNTGNVAVDFQVVNDVTISERNEWLTVWVTFTNGERAEYGFYSTVEVA